MKFIRNIENLNRKNTDIADGKGASLGEMIQNKIPVPQGFVILASAFDKFLKESDLGIEIEAKLHKVNLQNINSVDQASNEIRDLILDVEFPKDIAREIHEEFSKLKAKYVAVRSSATA